MPASMNGTAYRASCKESETQDTRGREPRVFLERSGTRIQKELFALSE